VGRTRFDLSRWSERARPADYAEMAPDVFTSAAQGDVVGMTIVIEGAAAISNLARALLARGAGHVCLLGGLRDVYPPYLDADVRRALVQARHDAMDGAIMMARRKVGLAMDWAAP
jgi:glucosamine kinase